ncbi:MAG TPA: FG-GAP-like repeat-containing protein [Actinomycetota bacterium]|nr:FG-GAP-like repeat-containing protein [Actinomycetota bacterium]
MGRIGGTFAAVALAVLALPSSAQGGGSDLWSADPTDQASARLGRSIDVVGDVSGDGVDDIIVGAPNYDTVDTDVMTQGEGRAYLFLGGTPGGPATTPAWSVDPTDEVGARFGASVAGVGDVTNDGIPDVIIGAPGFGVGDTGRAYVYTGTGTTAGLSATPAWEETPAGTVMGQKFGFSVAPAGDVDDDGTPDAIIGGEGTGSPAATAYIYEGLDTASALGAEPVWSDSRSGFTGTGIKVASAGDLDDDGFDDVLIGFYGFPAVPDPGTSFNEGRTYIFRGAATWPEHAPAWFTSLGDANDAHYGIGLSSGDVNSDGKEDIAIGADGVQTAWLFLGGTSTETNPTGVSTEPAWEATLPNGFGRAVDVVGDVDGDGKGDLLVGEPLGVSSGAIDLFRGTDTGLSLGPADTFGGPPAMGEAVAGGDIDDDGFADLLAGAPNYSSGGGNDQEGQAIGVFNVVDGLDLTPPTDNALKNLPTFQRKKRFKVSWTESFPDGGATYELEVRSAPFDDGFGDFASVEIDPAMLSTKFTGKVGRSYCFRVRATDNIGNYSNYSDEKCTAVPLDDRSLVGQGWKRKSGKGYYLNTYSLQSNKNKSLNLTDVFTLRVALVATKCPDCGKVRIKIGNEPPEIVNLKGNKKQKKRILPLPLFGQLEHGDVRITIVSDDKRVEIDGLGLARF